MELYNIPRPVELTYTSTAVSVGSSDTLVLSANDDRRYLSIRRGTTVGRVFVLFGSGTATTTNGELLRENQFIETRPFEYYTGEVRAISVGSSKTLYITEGVVL